MTRCSVEIIRDVEQLAALVPQWRDLWRRSEIATPFQSPDWLLPWWDVFAPGELRCVAVRSGERLVALAPLYQQTGIYGSRLVPLGVSLSDYLDILIDPAHPDSANELAAAVAEMDDIDAIEWGEAQACADVFDVPLPQGWEAMRTTATPCPVVALPNNPEELRNIISPSRWRHLRTAANRAARSGGAVIIRGDSDNAGALLSELVRLHTASCPKRGGNVFSDPRVAEFHAAALPRLVRENLVRIYALSIGGRIVGVYYGFHHRGSAYAYQCGYNPSFAFQSPGMLLIAHAMEQAIHEHAQEFDFLRGNESYKYEWGATDRLNVCYTLLRRQRARAHG
ncbi:MAG: GNAT family N-acetyltransferase [Alphaproteobacteria bacterium]|jgi:CelD/BcsL family acetyltransferase involved in cellulose biosynthesis